MKKHIKNALVPLIVLLLLTGCGISQNEYDTVLANNESLKKENNELLLKIENYEKYKEVIEYAKNNDYEGLLKYANSIKPKPDVDLEYVGTWISEVDNNIKFVLEENGTSYIGEHECTWEMASNAYGNYGFNIFVDSTKEGRYEFLLEENDKNHITGNSFTSNMPEYIPADCFMGRKFIKVPEQ